MPLLAQLPLPMPILAQVGDPLEIPSLAQLWLEVHGWRIYYIWWCLHWSSRNCQHFRCNCYKLTTGDWLYLYLYHLISTERNKFDCLCSQYFYHDWRSIKFISFADAGNGTPFPVNTSLHLITFPLFRLMMPPEAFAKWKEVGTESFEKYIRYAYFGTISLPFFYPQCLFGLFFNWRFIVYTEN